MLSSLFLALNPISRAQSLNIPLSWRQSLKEILAASLFALPRTPSGTQHGPSSWGRRRGVSLELCSYRLSAILFQRGRDSFPKRRGGVCSHRFPDTETMLVHRRPWPWPNNWFWPRFLDFCAWRHLWLNSVVAHGVSSFQHPFIYPLHSFIHSTGTYKNL